jgi:WD40 repeat protein
VRIFLSYGHDHYTPMALRLKHDLEAQGNNQVWFDVERLKVGRDWERYIEDGLDWASAVPGEGRFLLLLTPHSVRRPGGYCRDELARAYGRNLPIIPVMLSTVEPPLSISRMQWLDMRNCFPAEEHEVQYAKHFDQLLKALIEKQVPFEGVRQRLLNYLNPVSYKELSKYLLRFTGRHWVMQEVDEWLASSRRILWITGEAGVGKSALAAWLCDKRPEITAYHFCRFGNNDRVDARRALFSLAYQLTTQLPVYEDRLNATPLDKTVIETNVAAVFDRLFVDLLSDRELTKHKDQIVLIDALDEVTNNGRNELASLIGGEFDKLPLWLRLIVTSRPHEPEINFALQSLDPWKLDAGRAENIDDIRDYLRRELRPFIGGGEPSNELVNTIVDRSEGLFLYVSWVRQELEEGRISLGRVEEFPRGLGGVYANFFQRYFPDVREYESDYRPMLEAICAAREPMDRRDLTRLLGWSEYRMRSLCARMGSLFPVIDGRVHPFHQSVLDWLTDAERSGPYWIDVSAQEKRLADFAWREYKNGVNKMGRYFAAHAPFHLTACRRTKEARKLLLDFNWIQTKLQIGGISELLVDYDLALGLTANVRMHVITKRAENIHTHGLDTNAMTLVQRALRMSTHVLAVDQKQLAGQLLARLQGERSNEIGLVLRAARSWKGSPWLRPATRSLTPPGPLLLTLAGHSGPVRAVAVTPDGMQAVSGSADETLKVWDLSAGKEVRTLAGHSGPVRAVAVTPDGMQAVSGSDDETLKVWDLSTGKEVRTLAGHSGPVRAVAVTPDGMQAVSGSDDETLKVWDLSTGKEVRTMAGGESWEARAVTAVAVTLDGRYAISDRGGLRVLDLATGEIIQRLGPMGAVEGLTLTPNGQYVVYGEDSFTQISDWLHPVFDLRCGLLSGGNDKVKAVAVTPDQQQIISGHANGALLVWDFPVANANGSFSKRYPDLVPRKLVVHSSAITGIAIAKNGRCVVSSSESGALKVWDLANQADIPKVAGHSGKVTNILWLKNKLKNKEQVVSASTDGKLKVWDVTNGSEVRTLAIGKGEIYRIGAVGDGHEMVIGFKFKLEVWDLANEKRLRRLGTSGDAALAVTPDQERLVCAMSGGLSALVLNLRTGKILSALRHKEAVTAVALTPDGRRVITASRDQTLKIFDLMSGKEERVLTGHLGPIRVLAVTPDGDQVLSGSDDGTLKLWKLQNMEEVRTFFGHSGPVTALAVRSDGRLAISASHDHSVKVWELSSANIITSFVTDFPLSACCVTNGGVVVAGDILGCVHFLTLEGGSINSGQPASRTSRSARSSDQKRRTRNASA